ncbi:TFIIH/NER complex subunit [Arachnomyces sp. PD_36]|nr:TFIIH/NER complex subunit [Arachnomyces sp. PD_36]
MSAQRGGTRQRVDEDEVCPVCKSSRYLNPDMRFLINPECYHKMCESCVDRIFSSGPAPCPLAGCRKTLRKNRFRKQTFEDIGVEREVDIRKRVMAILNRREEEFDNKRAYDDFLEQREEIISNLIHNTDVSKTEAELSKYASENAHSIRRNKALESQESASFLKHQGLEQEQIRLRREAARQEYENEKLELLAGRENVLSQLASGKATDAEAIAREGQRVLLKKSSARRTEEERIRQKQAALLAGDAARKGNVASTADATDTGPGLIKGLKKIVAPEPEKPYDPFGGMDPYKRDYYDLQPYYPSQYLDPIRNNTQVLAGGYDLKEYYSRSLLEAFAGLGCFVDEEVAARDAAVAASKPTTAKEKSVSAGVTPTGSSKATPAGGSDDVF